MKPERLDEDLHHRHIVACDPVYDDVFAEVPQFVRAHLEGAGLVHGGSTAV